MNKKAFTLIELLAVIAIMGILAGLMLPALNKARDRARVSKCVATIASLQTALSMYQVDYGVYPYSTLVHDTGQHNGNSLTSTATNKLVQALTATTLGGPYMEFKGKDLDSTTETVLLDPWGQAYIYMSRLAEDGSKVSGEGPYHPDTTTTSNNTYNIYSLGPDKATFNLASSTTWDDAALKNDYRAGDWDSATSSSAASYDDINSWDGTRKGE